jgi:hypothetical protein
MGRSFGCVAARGPGGTMKSYVGVGVAVGVGVRTALGRRVRVSPRENSYSARRDTT